MHVDMNNVGNAQFSSSSERLNEGFRWAKEQALFYAHHGEDPVGLWYEAALPGRGAFCLRDTVHQSFGAAVLGLQEHTKNMFWQFANHIAPSRDYCTYWEITGKGLPAEVDYTDDTDFWYNLPANFDLIHGCWEQYLWTGDTDYLCSPVFNRFYKYTMKEFMEHWDKDKDGIPEHYAEYGRRGIASYNESDLCPLIAGDLIAAEYAGYSAYANILRKQGYQAEAPMCEQSASELQALYRKRWFYASESRFRGALLQNGEFYEKYYLEANFLPLYYGILDHVPERREACQDVLRNGCENVEGKTYFPHILYRNAYPKKAWQELLELMDSELYRREYPEVSYSVVGSIVRDLMGVGVNELGQIYTYPQLDSTLDWCAIDRLPILGEEVTIRHEGNHKTEITSHFEHPICWKAAFLGTHEISCGGENATVYSERDAAGQIWSCCVTMLKPGETKVASSE